MAKKDNSMIGLVLGGIGLYLLLNQQNQPVQYPYPQFPQVPQVPPQSNLTQLQQWVTFIISLVGPIASLWQPGGPFYSLPQEQKLAIADIYASMGLPIPPGAIT